MNLHLAEISAQIAADAHAVVILDQAGWHGAKRLRVPHNISLLPLPPDSPELNPVENLWQFLKHNFLNARIFDTYDAIVAACCAAWNRLRASYLTRSAPSPPGTGRNGQHLGRLVSEAQRVDGPTGHALVSWIRSSSFIWFGCDAVAEALDAGQDVIGGLGPAEGFGIGMVLVDERGDRIVQ